MFPPTKKQPKRVGGAPFSTKVHSRRANQGQPQSARTLSNPKATASAELPLSARNPPIAGQGDVESTPAARRAEAYYRQLLGRPDQEGESARQDWTLVEEIDALDHFNREEKKKREEREKNVSYRADLQDQLQARQNIVDKCREVWKDWRTELEDDVQQYQKEEEMKRVFKRETQKQFNQEREKQLDDIRRRQALQKEHEVKLEQEMMELAQQAKIRQDETDAKKKNAQRQAMQQMKGQAEVAAVRKKNERQEEQKRDIRMQQEYEEMLEEQERRRNKYFLEIREKQATLLAKYEKGVGNQLAKQQAADDERARRHQAAKELAQKQEHEAREAWRRNLAESGQAAVRQQLSLQAQERERKRQEDERYIEKIRKENAIADAKEAEKVQKKKDSVLANAEYVRKQIQEKEARSPARKNVQAQMTEVERRLNKEKLERACDPNRPDGLQSLLNKRRADYSKLSDRPISIPS